MYLTSITGSDVAAAFRTEVAWSLTHGAAPVTHAPFAAVRDAAFATVTAHGAALRVEAARLTDAVSAEIRAFEADQRGLLRIFGGLAVALFAAIWLMIRLRRQILDLRAAAEHDPLTEVLNRAGLRRHRVVVRRALERVGWSDRRRPRPLHVGQRHAWP